MLLARGIEVPNLHRHTRGLTRSKSVRDSGEVTAWPLTEVITSPGVSPACAAGPPETIWAISAPWYPREGLWTVTPKKAVGPM